MRVFKLDTIPKLIFTVEDIARKLSITRESARVTASRYVKQGLLLRLKNNYYIPLLRFNSLTEEELFSLANLIQTPSYISLTTALAFYNISTQQLQSTLESVALRRTQAINIKNFQFRYSLIKRDFYVGFTRRENYFIALPEKAIADSVYLTSLGKYNCDFDAVDFNKFDKNIVTEFIQLTNPKTVNFWSRLCSNYGI